MSLKTIAVEDKEPLIFKIITF